MDLRQLTYFLAVVDHGGFHRAAGELLISQPSLSQSIANLERELGVSLFHRVGRGVVLTQAGTDLVGRARTVLRDVDAARDAVLSHRGLRAGRVDLITMPSPGIEPLTGLIAAFQRDFPEMVVDAQSAFTPQDVLSAVDAGVAELGLVGAREPVRSASLDVLAMGSQPLILVVSPAEDSFGAVTTVTRAELAGHDFVVSHQGSLMRWMVDDVMADIPTDAERTRITAEVSHRTSILPLVLAGVGHAVLPSAWSALAAACGLRTLPIEPATLLHIAMVSRRQRLTPAAEAFLDTARRASRSDS